MTSPEDVHQAILDHEEFADLLENIDNQASVQDLRDALQLHGGSTEMAYGLKAEELAPQEVGWLRLVWEAHHQANNDLKAQTPQ